MNINEIAELAGVSRATVSRYLNDGYVSAEKKERIGKVIQETGYQPSSQAQMLRTKKTGLIGVIIPKINSEAVSRMVAGISLVLAKAGFQLLLANTDNKEKEELKYLNLFRDNHVDGIILIGTIFTREHKTLLKNLSVPIVILGQKLDGYSCVYHDDYHASKELAHILAKSGKTIGYLGVTKKDESAGHSRKKGFLDGLHESHVEVPEQLMMETDFSIEGAYEKTKEMLQVEPGIDSIFCATDNIAMGAMMYVRELGKRMPEDIQIVGFGDTKMAMVSTPTLTTVHLYYKTSGMEAATMLLDVINNDELVHKQIKIGYKVVKNSSTR